QALEGRDHRRRGGPQPPLGHRRDHPQRTLRGRCRPRRWRSPAPGREPGPRRLRPERGAFLMAKPVRTKNKDNARRAKKKISLLITERVEYVDWKDVNLLRRFMSDRAKIRARRVSGNNAQQQAEIAKA